MRTSNISLDIAGTEPFKKRGLGGHCLPRSRFRMGLEKTTFTIKRYLEVPQLQIIDKIVQVLTKKEAHVQFRGVYSYPIVKRILV